MQLSEYKQLTQTPKRKQQPEYELHKKIVRYLLDHYPKVLFMSDLDNQIRLTLGQARRNKALQKPEFSCPDLLILEPIKTETGKFCSGLFLELKAESPFKINGELKSNEHLKKQWNSLGDLNEKGYFAKFIWEFETGRKLIDWYLRGEK